MFFTIISIFLRFMFLSSASFLGNFLRHSAVVKAINVWFELITILIQAEEEFSRDFRISRRSRLKPEIPKQIPTTSSTSRHARTCGKSTAESRSISPYNTKNLTHSQLPYDFHPITFEIQSRTILCQILSNSWNFHCGHFSSIPTAF